ncbi:MAG: phosphonate ABC transporter substrate-binding protein, partial [Rhizobiaceae bacterium]|nr:phosphonate ABC transporter substrate-binding protein [Rhizobiaceae bacterium]
MLKKLLLATVAVGVMATSAYAEGTKVFRVGILGGENEADRLRNNQCLIDLLPA